MANLAEFETMPGFIRAANKYQELDVFGLGGSSCQANSPEARSQ